MRSKTVRLTVLALLLAAATALVWRVTRPRRVIAFVDGRPIRVADWRTRMRHQEGPRALEELIRRELVRREARRLGINVTREDIERERSQRAGSTGSEADLRRQLARAGVSYEAFMRELEDDVLFDKVLYAEAVVDRKSVADYYARYREDYRRPPQMRARLMVFDSKENAEAVRSVLDEPDADFAGLAKAFSTDPGTRDQGGDTGWFGREDYAAEVVAAAEDLEAGEISPVFAGPDGWYILQLSGRRPGGVAPLDEVYDRVESRVRQLKAEELRGDWLRRHWEAGEITVLDPGLGAVPLPLPPENGNAPTSWQPW